jgi:hypothetical protein
MASDVGNFAVLERTGEPAELAPNAAVDGADTGARLAAVPPASQPLAGSVAGLFPLPRAADDTTVVGTDDPGERVSR